ncbi:MAG: DUF2339 domain-containing protein [bacterium]|nr:DUF2339 domain-containing protein [bacterium]
MIEFFIFVGGVVLLVLVINLSERVRSLEQFIKSGATQHVSELSFKPQQFIAQQSVDLNPASNYIKQQREQGKSKEEIKNSLLANGWQASDIEKAFNSVALLGQLDQSSQPMVNYPQVEPTLSESDKFINWIKEDWLLKLGALLLLFGFGWLTTYAFLNNWIGPMGRISLGIIIGALFLSFGWLRMTKYIQQGGIFLVLGSTIILLTIFAGREIYDFFDPISALVIMFLSTALVAFASVKYKNSGLSLTSLILAGIAPLLTSSPITDYIGLFSYLFVVVLGVIWIVVLTKKRELTFAALLLIIFYSLPHLFSLTSTNTREILLLFAFAFSALFFLTNTIGILKLKGKEIIPDLITASINGLFLLAWIVQVAQDEWKSLIIAVWMIVFTVGAFLIFKTT